MQPAHSRPAVLEARGLTKVYHMGEVDVWALRGVDLDLYQGEFVVLLGPSGSGKSTLMKGIAGVSAVDGTSVDGWNRLAIVPNGRADVRELVVKAATDRGWGVRELRREVASLEDFFVKVVAEQSAAGRTGGR